MIAIYSIRNHCQKSIRRTVPARCRWACLSVSLLFISGATPTLAADFFFDVLYFGENVATLAPGSDDPDSTTLFDGDGFVWNIAAQDDKFWQVDVGGNFFALMALLALPPGDRTADFELTLLNDGLEVFNFGEMGIVNSTVHAGTNSVALSTGLIFDEMLLDYLLIEALEDPDDAIDPLNLQPIDTSLSGPLPIFGAPEQNDFSPGISYGVPEPASLSLLFLGGAALLGFSRKRNSR